MIEMNNFHNSITNHKNFILNIANELYERYNYLFQSKNFELKLNFQTKKTKIQLIQYIQKETIIFIFRLFQTSKELTRLREQFILIFKYYKLGQTDRGKLCTIITTNQSNSAKTKQQNISGI
ncbi:hypothetical protein pb186bvf_018475 [Paramecium bursaria]